MLPLYIIYILQTWRRFRGTKEEAFIKNKYGEYLDFEISTPEIASTHHSGENFPTLTKSGIIANSFFDKDIADLMGFQGNARVDGEIYEGTDLQVNDNGEREEEEEGEDEDDEDDDDDDDDDDDECLENKNSGNSLERELIAESDIIDELFQDLEESEREPFHHQMRCRSRSFESLQKKNTTSADQPLNEKDKNRFFLEKQCGVNLSSLKINLSIQENLTSASASYLQQANNYAPDDYGRQDQDVGNDQASLLAAAHCCATHTGNAEQLIKVLQRRFKSRQFDFSTGNGNEIGEVQADHSAILSAHAVGDILSPVQVYGPMLLDGISIWVPLLSWNPQHQYHSAQAHAQQIQSKAQSKSRKLVENPFLVGNALLIAAAAAATSFTHELGPGSTVDDMEVTTESSSITEKHNICGMKSFVFGSRVQSRSFRIQADSFSAAKQIESWVRNQHNMILLIGILQNSQFLLDSGDYSSLENISFRCTALGDIVEVTMNYTPSLRTQDWYQLESVAVEKVLMTLSEQFSGAFTILSLDSKLSYLSNTSSTTPPLYLGCSDGDRLFSGGQSIGVEVFFSLEVFEQLGMTSSLVLDAHRLLSNSGLVVGNARIMIERNLSSFLLSLGFDPSRGPALSSLNVKLKITSSGDDIEKSHCIFSCVTPVFNEVDYSTLHNLPPQQSALAKMIMSGFIEASTIDRFAISRVVVAMCLVTYIGCLMNFLETRLLFTDNSKRIYSKDM